MRIKSKENEYKIKNICKIYGNSSNNIIFFNIDWYVMAQIYQQVKGQTQLQTDSNSDYKNNLD